MPVAQGKKNGASDPEGLLRAFDFRAICAFTSGEVPIEALLPVETCRIGAPGAPPVPEEAPAEEDAA